MMNLQVLVRSCDKVAQKLGSRQSALTSPLGYNLPSEPPRHHVRSSPNSGPPSANVRNRVDFVRSIFRFGLGGCCRYTGSYDPFQTFEKTVKPG